MNTEQLDEFISVQALDQFAKLSASLEAATDEMVGLTTEAQKLVNTLGGSNNFANFIALVQKTAIVNTDMAGAVTKATVTIKQLDTVTQGFSSTLQKNIDGYLDAKAAIEEYNKRIADANAKQKEGTISGEKYNAIIIDNTVNLKRAAIDLADYTKAINSEISAQNLATKATQDATAETISNRLQVTANNAELKKQIELQQAVPGSIAEARIQSQLYRTELNNLNLTTEEGIARQTELRAALSERDSFIKNNVDAYTAQKINIGNYPDASAQLEKLNAEMQALKETGQENSAEFTALSEKSIELQRSMGGLQGELNLINKTLAEMIIAGKQGEAEFQTLAQRAGLLDSTIKEAKNTVLTFSNSTMGAGGSAATTSAQISTMTARLIELKAAGAGESVEVKELTAEILRLKTVVAETNETLKIGNDIGTKFTNIVEKMGLRMIANLAIFQVITTAATSLWEWWTKDSKAAEELTKKIKELDDTAQANAAKELATTKELLAIAQDVKQSMDIRLRAVKDLQDKYPDYLGNLSKEAILTGNTAEAVERLNTALLNKAYADAALGKTTEYAKANLDLKQKLDDATASMRKYQDMVNTYNESVDNYNKKGGMQPVSGFGAEARLGLSSASSDYDKIKKQISDNEAAMQKYQKDAEEFAKKAAPLIVSQDDKEKKTKTPVDNSLKVEQDLTKAIAEEQAKRLEIEAEKIKITADNETASYEDRLRAYVAYTDKQYEATVIRYNAEEKVIAEALAKIETLEGKKQAGGKLTAADTKLIDSKSLLLVQLKEKQDAFDLYTLKEQERTAKGIVDLQKKEVDTRVALLKSLNTNIDVQEQDALQSLIASLNAGTISYETYTKKKKALEDDFQLTRAKQQAAYIQSEIEALRLLGVNTTVLQELLDKANAAILKSQNKGDEDIAKKKSIDRNELIDAVDKFAKQGIDTAKDAMEGYYEKQLSYQQKVLDNIDKQANLEKDSINASLASQQTKNREILILDAKTAAQQKQIQLEINRLKREEAISDRAAAILAVTEQTAIQIIKGIDNPVLEAFVIATSALQIAAILAKPLPAYAEGIGYGNKGSHPGGAALVGEAGPELVQDKGISKIIDKPTIIDLSTSARVIPEKDLVVSGLGAMSPQLFQSFHMQQNNSELLAAFEQQTQRIENAVANIQQNNWIQTRDGWRLQTKVGNATTEYINKRLGR